MQYILENPYTKKLYEQIRDRVTGLKLLAMADVATLDSGQCFIVDEVDHEAFEALHSQPTSLIILTENSVTSAKSEDKIRYVNKYQSTKNILTLITQMTFPMTFLIFAAKKSDNDTLVGRIIKKCDIDTVISLDFSPNSSFSLFDSLIRFDYEVVNHANLNVIANIEDYLNPPTSDLVQLFNRLKVKKRLLIVSSLLKGALDSEIMDLADTIILVDNDPSLKLEPHLRQRFDAKRFEVMTYD